MSENHYKLDYDKLCHKLVTGPSFTIEEINKKRNMIIENLNDMVKTEITIDNFERVMTPKVLDKLVNLYDEYFFDNKIQIFLEENGCTLNVCFNNRCLKIAGKCYYKKRCKHLEIHLSSKVFKNALTNRKVKVRVNSGLECNSILSCMLITFEHEFVHGLLGCFCYNLGQSNTYFKELYGYEYSKNLFKGDTKPDNGHSNVFMTIVNKKFGHTKYFHELLSHDSIILTNDPNFEFFLKDISEFYKYKSKLSVDDIIYFNNYRGQVQGFNLRKKLKYKLTCIDKKTNRIWNIPYQFLVRKKVVKLSPKSPSPKQKSPKSPSPKPTSPKPPSPKPPRPKPPSPKPPKKKVRFSSKSQVISYSNNNKNTELKTKKKTKFKYNGPYENTYLSGLPNDYTKIYGKTKITDLEEAKSRCNSMGKESYGITQKGKYFSLRKGKLLKVSPSGEKSWIKNN